METNILIESQEAATRLLLSKNKAARSISENKAQVYVIYDLLSKIQPNNRTLTVWGVKVSDFTYAGVLIKSGIRMKEGQKFVNAVHISFSEIDIVCLKRCNNYLGAYLRLVERNGTLHIVRTISIPFEDTAREFLDKLYPETTGIPIVLLSTSAPNKKDSKNAIFWARLDGSAYKGVNIRSKNAKVIPTDRVQKLFVSGEKINGNYVYLQGKRGARIWFSRK